MAFMEGPLSKWTNVMKGWQYRWFVLDNNAGMLCYYTSKDKMMKGSRRGYVRLKNGLIGIDDEDDSTFTITTMNHQTFHFQARDNEERERWIEALERAIDRQRSNPVLFRGDLFSPEEYERKLMETDAYLQLLIEQNTIVQKKISACQDSSTKENLSLISLTTDAMIEAIKHAIVMLQISKESLKEPLLNGTLHEPPLTEQANFQHFSGARAAGGAPMRLAAPECNVPASYSSSDDEEFFDAEAPTVSPVKTPTKPSSPFDPKKANMEDLYNINDEEDLGSMEKHGSVIGHLLKQVRIGMDLTKVVLPTFILERRSLLEMYADFFAHPDLFCKIADMKTPKERMIQTLKWYLSTFHAGRPSEIAKKPYNPIQGETFQCYWEVPGLPQTKELNDDGPVPWATKENLCFVAEQVSHHPPISAFYAEHKNKKLSLDGYIWTKSKFLGLSIGVHMIGQAVVSVHNHDEEYVLTFPNGYGRSILTVPWVELGGTTEITCSKTGFKSQIDFHTKPFYGGKKHLLTAKVFDPAEKKPVVVIEGEWNGVMYAKYSTGMNETFIDTKKIALHPKQVRPLADQGEFESRRLWKEVTICLKTKDVEGATNEKHRLESRQREEAKERKEAGTKWETKYFHEEGEHWVYDKPLTKRMA